MINELPMTMLRCLLMTAAIECAVAAAVGVRNKSDLIYVSLVNVLTNPLVVVSVFIVNICFGSGTAFIYEIFIEIAVVIAEGLIYRKVLDFKRIHPLLLALILNAASFLSGEIYNFVVYNVLK